MKVIKLLVFLFLVIFIGCSGQRENAVVASNTSAQSAEKGGGGGGGDKEVAGDKKSINQVQPIERKIIRNAELDLETNSPEEAQQKIAEIIDIRGGFVIESQQSSSDVKSTTRDIASMTVRVPTAKFNESLQEIKKTASRVILESVKGQDVTEEFVDIEARLIAKKSLENKFLEIMKQGKTVEDALSIQKEIAAVREEIEQIEGRKRFLENQSSLSTIKIQLKTPVAFSSSSSGFFYELRKALGDGFDAALAFVLILVRILLAILPFLLLVVLPIYFVASYILKRKKKVNLADEPKLD